MYLVTVVLTTHNRPPDLVNRALKSVTEQTFSNLEIIVVDDSDSIYDLRDEVGSIVLGYDKFGVIYICHDECLGACAARNTGARLAKGDFIAFLDDDDEWKPDKIEKQLTEFVDDDVALVYCGYSIMDASSKETEMRKSYHSGYIYDKLIINNFIGSTSFPLIRRSHLIEAQGFDVEMPSAQDYDMWLRLARKHKVGFIREPLVIYHVHSGQQISDNLHKKIAGLERINMKNTKYLEENPVAWWHRNIVIVPYYAKNGDLIKALSTWRFSVKKCPKRVKKNVLYLLKIFKNTTIYALKNVGLGEVSR